MTGWYVYVYVYDHVTTAIVSREADETERDEPRATGRAQIEGEWTYSVSEWVYAYIVLVIG